MKKLLAKILMFFWCKDLSLMLYWFKTKNLKLLIDGIFFWKYVYVGNPKEFSNKFKKYLWNSKKYNDLIKWLDDESINEVNQIIKNIKYVLNWWKPYIKKIDAWITENASDIEKSINIYTKNIYLPIDHKEYSVFYYKHWINKINNLKSKILWKDILDCWAFIGDSAIMFSKELWFKNEGGIIDHIYCLEPDLNNEKLLKETINKNNKSWKIIPIALGVWKKKEKLYLNQNWSTSTIWSNWWDIIEIDKIDNIVSDYWIKPWLIKWDIEWLEYDSILWAEKTIKKYKPILLISIYHNWKDFFEIKPLIEWWNVWYKFKIKRLSNNLFLETMLICY